VKPETRRAFLDAALAKALCQSVPLLSSDEKDVKDVSLAGQTLETLDRALIMVGRAGDDMLLDEFIESIEDRIGEEPPSDLSRTFKVPEQPVVEIQHPVRRLDVPMSLADFARHLSDPCTPFVVSGCLDHWPALSNRPWSDMVYFERLVGRRRIVPIEIGSRYTDEEWSQKLVPFGAFLDQHIFGTSAPGDIEIQPAYLAQHNLLDQIPRLNRDIAVPDYALAASEKEPIMNMWFGPADTISPAHTDPYHNLYAQVVGFKYIRLFSPSETSRLYLSEGIMSNTSRVDVEDPDLDQYPDFADAEYVDVVVGPGDLLFIPAGWWHHVRSLTVSVSISFWI
jgi:lysine-specific demethylase 8